MRELKIAVGDSNHGAAGNNVVAAVVARASGGPFLSLDCQRVGIECLTIEVFFPLVCQNAAGSTECRMNKTHNLAPFKLKNNPSCLTGIDT